jgi:hypothetical protein
LEQLNLAFQIAVASSSIRAFLERMALASSSGPWAAYPKKGWGRPVSQ